MFSYCKQLFVLLLTTQTRQSRRTNAKRPFSSEETRLTAASPLRNRVAGGSHPRLTGPAVKIAQASYAVPEHFMTPFDGLPTTMLIGSWCAAFLSASSTCLSQSSLHRNVREIWAYGNCLDMGRLVRASPQHPGDASRGIFALFPGWLKSGRC